MIRDGLYRLLKRLRERYAFFVPNYVRTLNWEVMPLNKRSIDSFDRWLEKNCVHRVIIPFDRSLDAMNWLTNEATNFWGVHNNEGDLGDVRAFVDNVPPVMFCLRDSRTAFELKMKFG